MARLRQPNYTFQLVAFVTQVCISGTFCTKGAKVGAGREGESYKDVWKKASSCRDLEEEIVSKILNIYGANKTFPQIIILMSRKC